MVAPGVLSVMVIGLAEVKVPEAGEMTGIAAPAVSKAVVETLAL